MALYPTDAEFVELVRGLAVPAEGCSLAFQNLDPAVTYVAMCTLAVSGAPSNGSLTHTHTCANGQAARRSGPVQTRAPRLPVLPAGVLYPRQHRRPLPPPAGAWMMRYLHWGGGDGHPPIHTHTSIHTLIHTHTSIHTH